jgi:tetratricopeptide (TPR) repeat protein
MRRFQAAVLVLLHWGLSAQAAAPPALSRNLTAQEQEEVSTLQERVDRLAAAGEFAEAARLVDKMAAFRAERQGARHWQAINARFDAAAWQLLTRIPAGDRPAFLRARAAMAQSSSLVRKGNYREAEKHSREALAGYLEVLGEQHSETSIGYNNVAYCLEWQGKYAEALVLNRRALAIRLAVHGELHPSTARSYKHVASCLSAQGRNAEAIRLHQRSLAICLKVLGEQHPETAANFVNVASYLSSQGKKGEALPLYEHALTILRKVYGDYHPDTAAAYNNLAVCLAGLSKRGEALPLLRRALAIRLKVQGEQHPDTASAYLGVASCLEGQGKYGEAFPLYQHALALFLKAHGEQHPVTAMSYNHLASCLEQQGQHEEALSMFQRALAIGLKVYGEQHAETAGTYNNVARCMDRLGKYAEALPLFKRALTIRQAVQGEQHPDTASSYNNVAFCLDHQGKHGEALSLHQRALAIFLKVHGELHEQTANSFNNVAFCLYHQGKHGEALPLYQRAREIRCKVLGEEHPETAGSDSNIAGCLDALGKPEEALKLYRRALAIYVEVHGKQHFKTAVSYNNVAHCLERQGKHGEALSLHERALAIYLEVLGKHHPHTANSYNNMGYCLASQDRYSEALALLQRARTIWLNVLGRQHPNTTKTVVNMAFCLNSMGRRSEALRLIQANLPDQEAARFFSGSTGFDRALTFTSRESPHALLAVGLARLGQPRNALRHAELSLARGLLDDLTGPDPAERERIGSLTRELDTLGERLAPLLGLAVLSEAQRTQRDQLVHRRRQLETERARLASAVSSRQVLTVESIQRHLSADAALVLWIDGFDEHLACVLRHLGAPVWIRLHGSGRAGGWSNQEASLPSRCYATLTDPASSAELREALYRQRLAPLEKHLAGVKHLLVVPTGALARVPVEALSQRWTVSYVPSGSAFARAAALPSRSAPTQALVLADPVFTAKPPEEPAAPPHGLMIKAVVSGSLAARVGLLAGDVLMSYADKTLKAPADLQEAEGDDRVAIWLWREGKTLQGRIPAGKLGVIVDKRPISEALAAWRSEERKLVAYNRGAKWAPLPGTRIEARALASLLPGTRLLLGSAASEQRFEHLAASGALKEVGLLHLATHGEANEGRPLETALILAQDRLPQPKEQETRVLAGKRPLEGRLTVDAILRDWQLEAELVTLSACQTGLGADAKGEGMLGFAQALLQKGARSVLLSRWKVDDNATALLMVRFYENMLGKRDGLKAPLSKAESLREAKHWLRTLSREQAEKRLTRLVDGVPRGERGSIGKPLPVGKLEAGKDDRPFAHPYYWAAFVLIGDPR